MRGRSAAAGPVVYGGAAPQVKSAAKRRLDAAAFESIAAGPRSASRAARGYVDTDAPAALDVAYSNAEPPSPPFEVVDAEPVEVFEPPRRLPPDSRPAVARPITGEAALQIAAEANRASGVYDQPRAVPHGRY